ncbi:hypothetical protein GCM10011496_35170 [Polaromonas eurypsychrophila]|uniref:Uncharacterized protein n=2 Tax=Polaromonas eurypsychrophila TaxID=1614635 RepID=A0A916SSJ0_9BURK|nr:hypothetical protein GCM10011496_35170 [Polaromonas eurypsychrophila]
MLGGAKPTLQEIHRETHMQAHVITSTLRPTVALADYDLLRATYDMLLRAPVRNPAAINAAFEALDAAHARLKAAHLRQCAALLN